MDLQNRSWIYYYRKMQKAVITFCALNIVLNLAFCVLSDFMVDADIDEMYPKPVNIVDYKKSALTILITGSVVSMLIHFVGLYAAIKEHLILLSIYLFLLILTMANAIYAALDFEHVFLGLYWIRFIWSIFSIAFSAAYWLMLKQRQTNYVNY